MNCEQCAGRGYVMRIFGDCRECVGQVVCYRCEGRGFVPVRVGGQVVALAFIGIVALAWISGRI